MAKAARRVPPDWTHPKDEIGQYIPLFDGAKYERRTREWDEEAARWQEGLRRSYDDGTEWVPIEADLQGMTYTECAGDRPDAGRYMPQWPASQCTHWQMYEEVTEGTPVSPVFESPEELAFWMANHDANASPDSTASYQGWLSEICQKPLGAVMTSPPIRRFARPL
jgi:hypothetical protein